MQMTRRTSMRYWATPLISVAIGIAYFIGFSIGGKPGNGVFGLVLMVSVGLIVAVAGGRSETVRGLLDHRDERLADMDLRATAVTAVAMILAVLVGFVVDIARGGNGWPYDMIGAVGGVAYLAAVAFYRLRR